MTRKKTRANYLAALILMPLVLPVAFLYVTIIALRVAISGVVSPKAAEDFVEGFKR